ncbi:hypothetical protein HMPREF1544_00755 [Mucor circinelloides 1006PhL]|uniref:Uncharacterized protein n=1 Tax=Mucor circinelloides f. circinelloides (strain 1006PhL) TaxID=1220926 RepID=S2JVL0_MUCC1|nr:hypothetical protein HMPREF1544_00755 [Mucor circinelloides 1006PhL]
MSLVCRQATCQKRLILCQSFCIKRSNIALSLTKGNSPKTSLPSLLGLCCKHVALETMKLKRLCIMVGNTCIAWNNKAS